MNDLSVGSVPAPACRTGAPLIRAAEPRDAAALARLFDQMQRHYGRPVSADAALDAARIACQAPVHLFDPRTLLAFRGERVVGSLVMNVSFPAFELTRSLYIRDLYVAREERRSGIGRALVKAAAGLALREGFSALEWTTDALNAAARAMYESCGARRLERTYYRLFDDTLRAAADA
ncbi:MAG TPA: GNAT family N-acetyltransferase [Acetobacteraceae bacterium]|nr:GNAT family N-acetyltransferase [Acetobacteraceae bacterium]